MKLSKLPVLRPKVPPLSEAMCFVNDDTDDLGSKQSVFQQLLEFAIWLHDLLGANDDYPIFICLNGLMS